MRHPYPDYRDSGVEWLDDIPAHWELRSLRRMGSFFKGGGGTKEDEVENGIPCVRYGDLYTQHEFLIRNTRASIGPENVGRYRHLEYGDVLFAGSGETIEEIGKSAVSLIDGDAYCGGDVIVFRPSVEADAAFLGYTTDCRAAAYQKACMGRGVTVMHIYASELKHLLVPLPPVDEQRAIAQFLDCETTKIDELAAKKRLLLERLGEYRTALIARTVAQGLPPEAARAAGFDPSPPRKPSRVGWLGEIPQSWEVKQLRHVCHLAYGDSLPSEAREPGSVPVFGSNGIVDFHNAPNTSGPVIVIGRKGSFGAVNFSEGAAFAIDTTYFVDERCTRADLRWLYYVLPCTGLTDVSMDSAVPGLSRSHAYGKSVALPPVGEQRAIAEFLDQQTERIDVLVARVEMAIERLLEHRTALVTAAVTGKIDVRDRATAQARRVKA